MARGFNYAPGASAEVQQASEPGLLKSQLLVLGSSRNNLVRAAIAARPDCPLGLMVTLAHDFSAEVRSAVARNSHAQGTVMAYLATDRNVDVLTALLENPSLPREVVEQLAFHKKGDVRAAAAARIDAGDPVAPRPAQEDAHTPELAEHVIPVRQPITADGVFAPVFPSTNVVDIATGAPVLPPAPASAGPTEPAIPQIFSPHSTPGAPAPTRTAPVRGFKPKD